MTQPDPTPPGAPRIRVMPPRLASQIAAGEVVERPASAAKELIENALDAGATRCDVTIEGGGVTRLVVADDGRGMSREDAELSVERHATSKLFAIDDLAAVVTYGFRGEALPSIASVSRLSIRTRAAGDERGTLVEFDEEGRPAARSIGAPVGTTVELRDLFHNVPARRKFLRSANTESGHIAEVLESAALARPDVTFTLTRDGRRVREWLRVETLEERVRAVVGDGLARAEGERGPVRVEAYLSRPEHARAGASGLRLFVNARPVRDRALFHTLTQAYGSVLERGRYPKGVVYVDVPPGHVDVNVHPQKSEVRFASPSAVTDAVFLIVSTQIAAAFSLPAPPRSPWARPPQSAATVGAAATGLAPPSADAESPARDRGDGAALEGAVAARVAERWLEADAPPAATPARVVEAPPGSQESLVVADARSPISPGPSLRWGSLRFVAQLRQTYLLCEGPDGFYVVDQHAAAERVNFDKLRKQFRSRTIASQSLLFPLVLAVSPAEAELVEERAEDFAALGLDLRLQGEGIVALHSVPRLLARAAPERLVRDLLVEIARSGRRAFSDAIDLAIATMACHGSVRAGDPVTEAEARSLLSALDLADFAGYCPHGRPVVATTTWSELERRVGRR